MGIFSYLFNDFKKSDLPKNRPLKAQQRFMFGDEEDDLMEDLRVLRNVLHIREQQRDDFIRMKRRGIFTTNFEDFKHEDVVEEIDELIDEIERKQKRLNEL